MKKTFWKIFDIVINIFFVYIVVYLCYSLFFEKEKDVKRIVQLVGTFISYVIYIHRRMKQDKDYKKAMKLCEEGYKDYIGETFSKDRKSYNNLLLALIYFSTDEFQEARKMLEKLLKKCKSKKDYSVVYLFQALCFEKEDKIDDAVRAYEKLLQHDSTNSIAWSNLGRCHMEKDRIAEARVACGNALMYNPNNAYAYYNLGACYSRLGEPKQALDYTLKALQIKPDMQDAVILTATSYKLLGDAENAEKYCQMFEANGGDSNKLRTILKSLGLREASDTEG